MQKSTEALLKRKAKEDQKADLQARRDVQDKIQEVKDRLAKHQPKSKSQAVQKLKHQLGVLTV